MPPRRDLPPNRRRWLSCSAFSRPCGPSRPPSIVAAMCRSIDSLTANWWGGANRGQATGVRGQGSGVRGHGLGVRGQGSGSGVGGRDRGRGSGVRGRGSGVRGRGRGSGVGECAKATAPAERPGREGHDSPGGQAGSPGRAKPGPGRRLTSGFSQGRNTDKHGLKAGAGDGLAALRVQAIC